MNPLTTGLIVMGAGIGLVVQNLLMVRITQSASTIVIAMLLNSLVGIVLFCALLSWRHGLSGWQDLAQHVRWWTLLPGLLGSFFVFASISGYRTLGAATTIALLVGSQLITGLIIDTLRHPGLSLRALLGPASGVILLVAGAWLIVRRQF